MVLLDSERLQSFRPLALCCVGIAAYRFLPWITSRQSIEVSNVVFTELATLFQMTTVLLLIILNRWVPLERRALTIALVLGSTFSFVGSVLVIWAVNAGAGVGFTEAMLALGLAARGAGSGAILVGCGVCLSAFSIKEMALTVAAGFSLYGVLAAIGSALHYESLAMIVPLLPVLEGACFIAASRLAPPCVGLLRIDKEAFKSIPWGLVVLFLLCAVGMKVVGALIPASSAVDTFATSVFWMGAYIFVFVIYAVWTNVLNRDDVENLWPVIVLGTIGSFLLYSVAYPLHMDVPRLFLYAANKTILLFAWVFALSYVIKNKISCVLAFGGVNVLFLQMPTLLGKVIQLGKEGSSGAAEALATYGGISSIAAGVMVFALVCASFLFFIQSLNHASRNNGSDAVENASDRAIGAMAKRFGLSAREEEIVALIARGYTYPQIAETLFITLETVRSHSKSIYRKMDVHKKQELIQIIENCRRNEL